MEKVMTEIWVKESDRTLEADMERRVREKTVRNMRVQTIGQMFEKAGLTPDSVLQHHFMSRFGMSLDMDVCYFFDLLCELGSLDRLHMTYGQKLVLKRFLNGIYEEHLSELEEATL